MNRKLDNKNVIDYAIKTAKQEGRAEESAKAQIAIAKAEKVVLDTARNFKNMGLSIQDIAKGTGLSIEEIEAL